MTQPSDILDQASELEQLTADIGIEAARRKAQPEQRQRPDGTWPHSNCIDCDLEIEDGRLQMGKYRCFSCQEMLERNHGRFP